MEMRMPQVAATNTKPVALDDERSLTFEQWCEAEQISQGVGYKLKRLGLAPKFTHPPGTNIYRVSPVARREWHERMQKLATSKTAKLEAKRRSEIRRRAGKAAAASPNFNRKTKLQKV